ncbi:MAG: hypothetical protein RLZZ557_1430 [Bacteroidota bacterium]
MCTVIYSPTASGWLISSLRDEDPNRPKALFEPDDFTNKSFTGPIDPKGGGSWFLVSRKGTTIVLLNGAFENHIPHQHYRRSRGLAVKDLVQESTPFEALETADWEGMEPFTLVMLADGQLWQSVWDGSEKHLVEMDTQMAHIWSSSTLYDGAAKGMRKTHFQSWCHQLTSADNAVLMNCYSSLKDQTNGFLINRDEQIKTLSHTHLHCQTDNHFKLTYTELDTGISKSSSWKI